MKLTTFLFRTLLFIFLLFTGFLYSQNQDVDIQKYTFSIQLNDQSNRIDAFAKIDYKLLNPITTLVLDFGKLEASGKGMQVDSILNSGKKLQFNQASEKLMITVPNNTDHVLIYYHGIPKDGLIIGKNKYGDRTFFGDNWPNRAHQWLPVIDHPSDKALVEWLVTAPNHYQVIANGTLMEETNIDSSSVFYHYLCKVPLPTKVMVIGATEFAVQHLPDAENIPVSSWVYPENKTEGFKNYAYAPEILKFYISHIGPYPFSKLANVQSSTRYGGMENAGNIFYSEKSVNGNGTEFLMAHEIAHQWFGDSASETDWSQLYLSEGFATYFTDLYAEDKYGEEKLQEKLREERQKVINFSKTTHTAIIDSSRTDYMKLLNPNSYQKGAWTLHMLRRKVGDENFWKAIKEYYKEYQFSNASSADLKKVFEKVSGENLDQFFKDWTLQYGQPVLKIEKEIRKTQLQLKMEQKQENLFHFPLEIKLNYADGSSEIKTFQVNKKQESYTIDLQKSLKNIEVDPNVNLLFEKWEAENHS